jgi:hypothetical protein
MNSSQVLAELFRITGALAPVSPATVADLEELRRRLAHSFFDLPGDGISSFVPSDDASRGVLLELKAIVANVALERATPGAAPRLSRLRRRDLPLYSANQSEQFPARSGAHRVRRTFGPMLEDRERFVFFDLFEAADFVRVVRHDGPPFLLLPADVTSADGLTFTFGRGSIWIEARLLAPAARGFTGLRVAGGNLVFRQVAGRIDNRIVGPAQAVCTLSVTLDPPSIASASDGAGQDAGLAVAVRPANATFEFSPQRVERIQAGDGSLTVFGATVNMIRSEEPAVSAEPAVGVLVPFQASAEAITPVDVRSTLLRPSGTCRIAAVGWLLPTSVFTKPDELGEAADAGAMAIVLERGLAAVWLGLDRGLYSADSALVAVDSRELALIANGRTARIARQEMALWRDSSLELLFEDRFQLEFVSSRNGAEAVVVSATLLAHLDRPLQADGGRPRIRMTGATVFLAQNNRGDTVHIFARQRSEPGKFVPLALANALLKTTPVEELKAVGLLMAGKQVAGASLRLTYGLHAIYPFLPDPYAANFDLFRRPDDVRSTVRLTSVTTWSGPDSPSLALLISDAAANAGDLVALLPPGRDFPERDPEDHILRRLFDSALGVERERTHPPLVLLDLSSNADHLGVGTAFPKERRSNAALTMEGVSLSAAMADLRVVALPQISWEPVRTHPDDLQPGFPQPLVSRDDGGPLVIGVADETVHLVPIAPEPLLRGMVELAERPIASVAIQFTLPFGIKAVAVIPPARGQPSEQASLSLNQPHFGPFSGGLQVSLKSVTPLGLPGGAIQTANSTTGSKSVLHDVMDGFFNNAFHPGNGMKRVPLSRIDFSGYGASAFSKWVNENASAVDITKVEFDVITGRTNYEVVEIQSILWPCMARVVRRITIRREGNGSVLRRDSGWVAATPGLFVRPDCACVVHPGVVKGMFNIREIRDTPQRVHVNPSVELQVVYFDTDVAIENVARGHAFEGPGPHGQRVGFVPSQRQVGFVQLINLNSVQKTPLTPQQLAELLEKNAPVGGPVDCELNIAGSEQRMRAGSVYASVAPQPGGGDPHFAVAAFGAPDLPREGQWSVVRMRNAPPDSPEPEPVDPRLGVPLIRSGDTNLAPSANPHPYRFADPADLLKPTQPAVDYAFLFATQTFRVLFPRVKIEAGSRSITSNLAPVLADAYSMMRATGLFPRLKHALAFPSSAYELRILGAGRLRLSPSPLTHTMPPRVLDIVKAAGIHAFTEYRGGDRFQTGPARIELRFDSNAVPSWELKIGPVSNVTDIDPFGPLMRVISTLEANSAGRPKGSKPLIEYGGALRPLEDLITVMKEFGLPVDMLVETPNSSDVEHEYKFKMKLDIFDFKLSVPGKIEGEISLGVEFGTKRPKHAFVPAPNAVVAMTGPAFDPLGSVELFVEIKGKLQMPIIKPLIYGGGLIRLQFITGFDPSEHDPIKREIKLAAAAVGSVGGHLVPKLVKVEGEVRYGYVFVADFAKEEYHPGVLLGFALECEVKKLFKMGFEAEVIGLVKRIDDEDIHVRAEFTVAGEIELFDMLSFEYAIETEWDQKLPSKVIAALAVAAHFHLLPLPIPP